MESKSKTKTESILVVLNVLAWIAFIGFLIEAGAILVSFGVSLINPGTAKNLYKTLDLEGLRQYSFWYYAGHVSLLVAFSALKAYVWFLVIKTISKINLVSPFTREVAKKLENISYVLLEIWIIAVISTIQSKWLLKTTGEAPEHINASEFLFMAGLVFVIAQIFKRGVEMQAENELTV